jgi:hypothetical protein
LCWYGQTILSKLGELLVAQLPKFEGKRIRLAEAIELTPSRLTRAIKGEYALDVRNCLRLAVAAGIPATQVLQAAGKADIAQLIERLYGEADSVTAVEREHLRLWRALSEASRSHFAHLIETVVEKEAAEAPVERPVRKKRTA